MEIDSDHPKPKPVKKSKSGGGTRHLPNLTRHDTKENQKLVAQYIGPGQQVLTWYGAYYSHATNARHRGYPSELTFKDYLEKIHAAGITQIEKIGRFEGQYRLKRHEGTTGSFTRDNCAFYPITKPFEMTDANGIVVRSNNVTKFALEHSLNPSTVRSVLKGRVPHHKGWTGRYVDSE